MPLLQVSFTKVCQPAQSRWRPGQDDEKAGQTVSDEGTRISTGTFQHASTDPSNRVKSSIHCRMQEYTEK